MSTDIKVLVNEIENYLWPTEEEYRKSCADFTALLPVYIHDDLNHFMMAVKSVFKNTVKPAEILIMQDGPVHENMVVFIDFLIKKYPHILHHISNKKNQGLGYTAAKGVLSAKFEIIARVDADDLSAEDRFAKQLQCFCEDAQLDIVGSNIAEFNDDYEIQTHRTVPSTATDIDHFSKMRSPLNHPSVMYKKESVIQAGNYADIQHFEDYDLFVRMLAQGQKAKNVAKNLVFMRAPESMYERRGGAEYVRKYISFRKKLLHTGYIGKKEYLFFILGSLLTSYSPVFVRKILYRLFLRKN